MVLKSNDQMKIQMMMIINELNIYKDYGTTGPSSDLAVLAQVSGTGPFSGQAANLSTNLNKMFRNVV